MQNNTSKTFHPPQSSGTWRYVALALVAHGTLLLTFIWDTSWTDQIVKLQSILGYHAELPKIVEIQNQDIDTQLTVDGAAKLPSQSDLASSLPKDLKEPHQPSKPSDKLELAAAESALQQEKSLKEKKMLEAHDRELKLKEINAQKIKTQLAKEQLRKNEHNLVQKQRDKARQLEANQLQMKSKQIAEKQKNASAEAKKEAKAKKGANNLSEAYRQENIQRMQKILENN
jgi:hypothetical protein